MISISVVQAKIVQAICWAVVFGNESTPDHVKWHRIVAITQNLVFNDRFNLE